MTAQISELEKAWLEAETIADEARHAAEVYEAKRSQARSDDEIKLLAANVEQARARFARAEQMAAETFDRLWEAKAQGQMH
jgi:hypothetical protein